MIESFESAECAMSSIYGESRLHVFSFGRHEEDNILCVVVNNAESVPVEPILVRVQSACYTAEIFRSDDCDCHEQLERSLRRIHADGGVLVYMICDGRGAGLLTKIRGLALGDLEGLDTYDAYTRLGSNIDPRDYRRAAQALDALGVTRVKLLTNNPLKVKGLSDNGIAVQREPLLIPPTERSTPYLETKRLKMGHLIPRGLNHGE